MTKNMGNADKAIRVVLATIMIILYAMEVVTGTLGIVLIIASIVFLLTSIVRFCPLYVPFGISTCKND